MKLYLVDTEKIYTFDLPNKVNGSFLFSFKGKDNRENTINVDAINDNWVIKSNGSVDIINNGSLQPELILKEFMEFSLQVIGEKELNYLYSLPFNDISMNKYAIGQSTTITIGNGNCNISYNNKLVLPSQLNISFSGGEWYVVPAKEEQAKSYLNNKRIRLATKIHTGDVIFINGLKIIWMKKFFVINNPNESVTINGLNPYIEQQETDNSKYEVVSEEEAMIPLYSDNDYFTHTPRLRTVVEHEDIEIDPPPGNQEKDSDMPIFLSIAASITMVASSLYMLYNSFYNLSTGRMEKARVYPMIVMAFLMLFASLVVPRLTKRWQKKQMKKREQLRQTKYGNYLSKKEKDIQQALRRQSQIITENNIPLQEVATLIKNNSRTIWSREIKDDDFLKIRMGIGITPADIKITAPEEHFTLDEDDLTNKAIAVPDKYKMLENVPVSFSLVDNNITSFIFDCGFKDSFIDGLLLQIFTYHSSLDLKIVLFTDEKNEDKWHYLKKLPHFWNEDHSVRFFSTNTEETKNILTYLDKEFTIREEKYKGDQDNTEIVQEKRTEKKDVPYTKYETYYLVITDNYKRIKDSTFLRKFFQENQNLGFSLVFFGDSMKNLPQECNTFVQIYDKESGIFNKELNTQSLIKFKADYDPTINMEEMATKIANIPVQSRELAAALPTSLSFLEMYNVGKIEQLNVLSRWSTNDPTTSLSAPIGVHVNGDLFNLDLHEKYDGPHGLIAGSTGSGKSEFIITYILSMAINFHPNEVQFVLIDYKGGGLTGAFENRETGVHIPHLVGTITNLDTAEMNRTLVSIESELKRRQAQFNRVRDSIGESTMDIYKYQRLYREGIIKEPMSHLFIISDEFAELKSQQPDFMAQLISTSRIGRSLGVHLILATQKPSGVVNDQIWSNSKFKVCLKVQSRSDSMEMLKRPEAASIKEAGRFYLQVGFDEYFDIGQSGWSGARYIPAERIIKKIDDSINFINNNGTIIKTVDDAIKQEKNEKDQGDQLTNIVRYLYDISIKENIKPRKMWLDSLKDFITIDDLIKKYNYKVEPHVINPIIGEYDSPRNQTQGLYTINFNETGNLLIHGVNGSGKENLISSILYSICTNHSPEEVNIYIGDFGAETLTVFNKMPQVGDVFVGSEDNKLVNLVKQLEKELLTRKKEFVDYGGSFNEYNKQNEKKLPLIIVVLNSFETFQELYPRMTEMFNVLFRDGAKYGIVFITSTSMTNAIRGKVAQNFTNVICLKLADPSNYRDLLLTPRGMAPADKFGRGIGLVNDVGLEFQSAFVVEREKLSQTIREKCVEMAKIYTGKVPKIKVLPEKCVLDDVLFEMTGLNGIPVGIELNSLEVYIYDFTINNINLIAANNISNHIHFLYALTKEFILNKNRIRIIDALNIYKGEYEGADVFNSDFDTLIRNIAVELNQDATSTVNTIYMFIGVSTLKEKLNDQNKIVYEEIFKRVSLFKNSTFIFADDLAGLNNINTDEWYRANVDTSYGLWLGEDVGSQLAINIGTLSLDDKKIMFPFIGYPIYKGNHMIIKYVVDGMEEKENGE